MPPTLRVRNTIRGLLQSYGPPSVKRRLWNSEFSRGRWDGDGGSSRDVVYQFVENYAAGGSILDLGCGQGRAGNELDETKYARYTGVDVSDVALAAARQISAANGRADRHEYAQSDLFSYVPDRCHDVILFMESIYYVPWARISSMLARYAQYLDDRGVFIVRVWSGTNKYRPIVDIIERDFQILQKHVFENPDAIVVIFRDRPWLSPATIN
ncbi:MAG: hypothetical protein DMF85_11405 [Acidobacteria bacterium]|nr:MAG: hypothetical protein DMF85_11405 [Acidobacteriota bacterium]